MEKKYLALLITALVAAAPMKAMQRRNPEDSCCTRVKKAFCLALGLGLLGRVILTDPNTQKLSDICLPEDEMGGRCMNPCVAGNGAGEDASKGIKIPVGFHRDIAPLGLGSWRPDGCHNRFNNLNKDSNKWSSLHSDDATVYDIQ